MQEGMDELGDAAGTKATGGTWGHCVIDELFHNAEKVTWPLTSLSQSLVLPPKSIDRGLLVSPIVHPGRIESSRTSTSATF